jgi:hypothetical protein
MATNLSVAAQGITGLASILSSILPQHTAATNQVSNLLAQASTEAINGNWDEVHSIAESIRAVPGISQTAVAMASGLAKAASNANTAFKETPGTAMTLSNQQLVLSEIGALSAQLNSENHSIFGHLFGASSAASAGHIL